MEKIIKELKEWLENDMKYYNDKQYGKERIRKLLEYVEIEYERGQ